MCDSVDIVTVCLSASVEILKTNRRGDNKM